MSLGQGSCPKDVKPDQMPKSINCFDMGSEGRTHIGTEDPVAETGHCIFRMPECVYERVWEYAS